jgi:hypothetical protein
MLARPPSARRCALLPTRSISPLSLQPRGSDAPAVPDGATTAYQTLIDDGVTLSTVQNPARQVAPAQEKTRPDGPRCADMTFRHRRGSPHGYRRSRDSGARATDDVAGAASVVAPRCIVGSLISVEI